MKSLKWKRKTEGIAIVFFLLNNMRGKLKIYMYSELSDGESPF